MTTLEERIHTGSRAKEVLDNETFQWALDSLKKEVMTAWEQSPARDSEGREKLWVMFSLANKLELSLKSMLETGKMAQLDLEHKNKVTLLERARNVMR